MFRDARDIWFVTYVTNEISKNKYIIGNLSTNIRHRLLKILHCYINEFVQELLDNISIFYYDAELSVNVIALEPL